LYLIVHIVKRFCSLLPAKVRIISENNAPMNKNNSRRDVIYDPFRCLFPSVPTSSTTRSDDTLGG
jgi:hypothetical protein